MNDADILSRQTTTTSQQEIPEIDSHIQGFPKLIISCRHFSQILPTGAELATQLYMYMKHWQKLATQSRASSQSEGHSSKWLIWLVCRGPLHIT